MAIRATLGQCALTITLLINSAQLSNGNGCNSDAAEPIDCAQIKQRNSQAESGVYTIQPSVEYYAFSVYCDMTDTVGFTKILQIATPYTVTRNPFGNISTGPCFNAGAKLSDHRINLIRVAREKLSKKGVIYRVTALDTTNRVYMWTHGKEFNDLKAGWGVFQGSRKQCLAESLDHCHSNALKSVNHRTLDTLHDGTGSGEAKRFFTDHDGGNTKRRCWTPNSSKRCVSAGSDVSWVPRYDVELWMA